MQSPGVAGGKHGATSDRGAIGPAGPLQGVLLLLGSCISVFAAVLVTPTLPAMAQHFAADPAAPVLVPLVLVVPWLFLAVVAPFAGALADRFGRNRLMVTGLAVAAVVGVAPAWLPSLPLILVARALLGMASSVVFVCCTALLAEYWAGERRERYLGLQVVVTSLSATVIFIVGGALTEVSWRAPFGFYAVLLLLVPPVARWLPEPVVPALRAPGVETLWTAPVDRPAARPTWRLVLLPCVLTVVGSVLFAVVPTQLTPMLLAQGMSSPVALGVISGGMAVATAIGGFLAGSLVVRRLWVLLPLEFGLIAVGLLVLGAAAGPALVGVATAGAIVASAGAGLLICTLLVWTVRLLDLRRRGLGVGTWSASLFFGQFLCPVLVLALTADGGRTLEAAIGLFGVVAAVIAVVSAVMSAVPAVRAVAQPPPEPALVGPAVDP